MSMTMNADNFLILSSLIEIEASSVEVSILLLYLFWCSVTSFAFLITWISRDVGFFGSLCCNCIEISC